MPQFFFEEALGWVLTPRNLAELMIPLAENGILELACAGFEDTAPPGFEFGVFFRPEPDVSRRVESWKRMAREATDPLPGSAAAKRRDALLTPENGRSGLRQRLRGLPGVARLRRSRAWKYTAPLRKVLR